MIFEWEVVGIHQFMNDKTKCKLSFNWCTKPWITDVFVCKHLILIRINILNLVLWNNVCLHKTPHNHCFDFLTRQVHSFVFIKIVELPKVCICMQHYLIYAFCSTFCIIECYMELLLSSMKFFQLWSIAKTRFIHDYDY